MTYAFIGPESSRLGGSGLAQRDKLHRFATHTMKNIGHDASVVMTGLNWGWDVEISLCAVRLHLPLMAVPITGQERAWSRPAQVEFWKLMDIATLISVTKARYYPYRRRQLNEWMVDNADVVMALYDGQDEEVGHCIKYAKREDVQVVNLWEEWECFDNYRRQVHYTSIAAHASGAD